MRLLVIGNYREDNYDVLGVVSDQYEVVQNWDAFKFLDSLSQDGVVRYEAAGSLKGGKIVWVLARMPEEFVVAGNDRLRQYVMFHTSHDGSCGVAMTPTDVRVVCMNTFRLASDDKKAQFTVSHRGDIKAQMEQARQHIMSMQTGFDLQHQKSKFMSTVSIKREQVEAYLKVLIPDEDGINNSRRERSRQAILAAYADGPQNLPEIRGTAWAMFNAVTQHVDHNPAMIYRGKNTDAKTESRMLSVMTGSNADFKESAFNLALQVAEAV